MANSIDTKQSAALDTNDAAELESAERLITTLGLALHRFGSPAHRLEDALALVARKLGIEGRFFSTPTAIFASIGPGLRAHTHLLRVEPGEVNLEKLSQLDALLARILEQPVGPEVVEEVDRIVDAPLRYGAIVSTLAFGLVSASAARFFGGGIAEIIAGALVGLSIGLVATTAHRFPSTARLFEPFAAMLAALSTAAISAWVQPVSFYVVTMAGLIALIPGLSLTVAINELATRNLVSGSARLAGALLVFLSLGFGVAIGNRMAVLGLGPIPSVDPVTAQPWTEGLALGIASIGLSVLFRAQPRDIGWILIAGAIALAGGRTGAALLGPELGACLGAFLVAAGGNLFARTLNRPSSIVQLPGLMLLVPGSIGFRSIASLLEHQTLSGIQAAFAMILVAMALVVGLLLANVLLPPRRVL